jgi:hypothetical protein
MGRVRCVLRRPLVHFRASSLRQRSGRSTGSAMVSSIN